MRVLLQDSVFAFRQLRKSPGFAVTAILSLALGIGATTTVFSVVYGVLMNPYPYRDPDRMVHLVLKDKAGNKAVKQLCLRRMTIPIQKSSA